MRYGLAFLLVFSFFCAFYKVLAQNTQVNSTDKKDLLKVADQVFSTLSPEEIAILKDRVPQDVIEDLSTKIQELKPTYAIDSSIKQKQIAVLQQYKSMLTHIVSLKPSESYNLIEVNLVPLLDELYMGLHKIYFRYFVLETSDPYELNAALNQRYFITVDSFIKTFLNPTNTFKEDLVVVGIYKQYKEWIQNFAQVFSLEQEYFNSIKKSPSPPSFFFYREEYNSAMLEDAKEQITKEILVYEMEMEKTP